MLSKEVAIIASLLSNDIRIEGSACWDLTPFMLLKCFYKKEGFFKSFVVSILGCRKIEKGKFF